MNSVTSDEKASVQAFGRDVKSGVDAYFRDTGLSKHANAAMVVKTLVLLTAYSGSYTLILSGMLSLAVMWPLCLVMGVAMAGIGFCVAHDALHGAYSANPRVNRTLGYLFDALGANSYIWKLTHNVIHHTYTNINDYDEDLEVSPLIRLSPHTPHQLFHRFQHVFAFVAYSFATIFWLFVKDYKYFLKRNLGPFRGKGHPASEWTTLFAGKVLYYLSMIALPFVCLDITWWQFLIGFLSVHLTAGLILGVVFQLAHVVEPTTHVAREDAAAIKHVWMAHQMRTTNNFARGNRLLSWYVGLTTRSSTTYFRRSATSTTATLAGSSNAPPARTAFPTTPSRRCAKRSAPTIAPCAASAIRPRAPAVAYPAVATVPTKHNRRRQDNNDQGGRRTLCHIK